MISKIVVSKARALMKDQTEKNGAPGWNLTELAVKKGRELANKYSVDENTVVVSLYLAHIVFSPVWKGDVQKNHPALSAELAKKYLDEWNVDEEDQEIIINSIEAHHDKVETKSEIAEVVKNAECFKFVTLEGADESYRVFMGRGYGLEDSRKKVIEKMEQKMKLLTLPECIEEAKKEEKNIRIRYS